MKELIEKTLSGQRENLVLWMPVAFGAGVGVYFALTGEPPGYVTGLGFALTAALWLLARPLKETRPLAWLALTALFLCAGGFAAAQGRTMWLSTIMLKKAVGPVNVTGTIAAVDELEAGEGLRLILDDLVIEKIPNPPARVRIRVRHGDNLHAGDRVTMLARLNPPSAPVAPHAFDFQRYAYFSRLGAFGFAYKDPVVIKAQGGVNPAGKKLALVRQAIGARIDAQADPHTAAVMTALITGAQTAVGEDDWDAFRISGLAHMLSISGMHIGIVAGLFFFSTRFLMALFPAFALRHPIKKYAALIALAGALFYTLLSGSSVPAVRSMIMTGVALFAVLIDRTPFSIRTVALAAMAVLLCWPESLWSASFQMSFAAVTALIVGYEGARPYMATLYRDAGIVRRLALYFAGVCLSTLAASLAVDPLVFYHFQQIGLYSIPANMAAAPVMAFVIMPAAVLACFMMPLGWEGWPLRIMAKGTDFVIGIAHETASWPDAALYGPALPLSVLLWTAAGALVLLFWRGRGKAACLLFFIVAIVLAAMHRQPDILVSSDAKLIAARDVDGDYLLSSKRADCFSAENWLRRNGQAEDDIHAWPAEGEAMPGMICGEGGCRWEHGGRKVAFSFAPYTHPEDCAWADILVAQDPVRVKCKTPVVIDRFSVWREGAYAVWLDGRAESVQSTRGTRPWTISNRR